MTFIMDYPSCRPQAQYLYDFMVIINRVVTWLLD
jgi:hypothetical protein